MIPHNLRLGSFIALLAGAGAVILLQHRKIQELQHQGLFLHAQMQQLTQAADDTQQRSNDVRANVPPPELLRLRAETTALRRQLQELQQQTQSRPSEEPQVGSPATAVTSQKTEELCARGKAVYSQLITLSDQFQEMASAPETLQVAIVASGLPDEGLSKLLEQRLLGAELLRSVLRDPTRAQNTAPQQVMDQLGDLKLKTDQQAEQVLLALKTKADSVKSALEALQNQSSSPTVESMTALEWLLNEPTKLVGERP